MLCRALLPGLERRLPCQPGLDVGRCNISIKDLEVMVQMANATGKHADVAKALRTAAALSTN